METKSCAIFGHMDKVDEQYRQKLVNIITDLIENKGVTRFYSGAVGCSFICCCGIIRELKNLYPQIKMTKVRYSMHEIYNGYDCLDEEYRLYDDSVYLLKEYAPRRYIVFENNKLLVDKADYIVASVESRWGEDYAALEYARKRNKPVIRVTDDWEV